LRHMKLTLHIRQRHVHNADVEDHHELRDADDSQDECGRSGAGGVDATTKYVRRCHEVFVQPILSRVCLRPTWPGPDLRGTAPAPPNDPTPTATGPTIGVFRFQTTRIVGSRRSETSDPDDPHVRLPTVRNFRSRRFGYSDQSARISIGENRGPNFGGVSPLSSISRTTRARWPRHGSSRCSIVRSSDRAAPVRTHPTRFFR